jgi:N-(2-amino-2-carboxyethyl)-L-glutamate synthase
VITLVKTNLAVERDSVISQVGNTPMVKIYLQINGAWSPIHLKMEGYNPAGSSKDRPAAALIADMEERFRLNSSSIVIESTSGNLGVALAFCCRELGYRFLAVIDPKTTPEIQSRMLAFGAELELVTEPDETGGYLLTRMRRIRELCDGSSHYVWTNQYSNNANPRAYYASMAPEIYQQMEGNVDTIFIAVSTGGTLAGVGRYFREVSPSTRIIGVDAQGSVVFTDQAGPRKLTGIGSSRKSSFIQPAHFDDYTLVNDAQAFEMCWRINEAVGLKVGGSSGAALFACAQYLQNHPETRNSVCVCADNGTSYESTIFNRDWLQSSGCLNLNPTSFVDKISFVPA